jgi:hypothetical protein
VELDEVEILFRRELHVFAFVVSSSSTTGVDSMSVLVVVTDAFFNYFFEKTPPQVAVNSYYIGASNFVCK